MVNSSGLPPLAYGSCCRADPEGLDAALWALQCWAGALGLCLLVSGSGHIP